GSPILPAVAPDILSEIHALEAFRLRNRGPVVVFVDDRVDRPGARLKTNERHVDSGFDILGVGWASAFLRPTRSVGGLVDVGRYGVPIRPDVGAPQNPVITTEEDILWDTAIFGF